MHNAYCLNPGLALPSLSATVPCHKICCQLGHAKARCQQQGCSFSHSFVQQHKVTEAAHAPQASSGIMCLTGPFSSISRPKIMLWPDQMQPLLHKQILLTQTRGIAAALPEPLEEIQEGGSYLVHQSGQDYIFAYIPTHAWHLIDSPSMFLMLNAMSRGAMLMLSTCVSPEKADCNPSLCRQVRTLAGLDAGWCQMQVLCRLDENTKVIIFMRSVECLHHSSSLSMQSKKCCPYHVHHQLSLPNLYKQSSHAARNTLVIDCVVRFICY